MSPPTVIVYTKPSGCPGCIGTKRWLDKRGIKYTEISLADVEPKMMDQFREWGYAAAPVVLIYRAGVLTARWSEFRPDLLEKELS